MIRPSVQPASEPDRAEFGQASISSLEAIDRRTLMLLAVIAVGLPALLCLAAIDAWRYRCLSGDSWYLAEEFRVAYEDGSWLRTLFTRVNDHWVVPCKAILFAALQWLPRDVDRLTCVGWLTALFIMVLVVKESGPWLKHRSKLQVLAVWLTAALFVFTLKQTYSLLWEACFYLHFPLAALSLMIWQLKRDTHWVTRVIGAAAAGLAAVFSFGVGVASVWAVFPVIWLGGQRAPVKTSIVWFFVAASLTVVQFGGIQSINADRTSLVRTAEQPLMAVQFALAMLGGPLSGGTSFEPINQGVAIGTVGISLLGIAGVVLWRRRSVPGLLQNAAPWLAWSLYSLGAVALVTAGRLSPNLGIPLTGRYVALALPFGAGIFILSALLWGQNRRFPFVVVMLGGLLVLNWQSGAVEMRYWTAKSRQEAASVALTPFLPIHSLPRIEGLIRPEEIRKTAAFLRERDVLRRVPSLSGVKVGDFALRSELAPSQANFDGLWTVANGWAVSGRAILSQVGRPPDLVLLSFESEGMAPQIIDTAVPNMPPDYFENATRLRENRNFYNGWQRVIPQDRVPARTAGWVRAWAWNVEANRLFPIAGRHRINPNPGAPQPAP